MVHFSSILASICLLLLASQQSDAFGFQSTRQDTKKSVTATKSKVNNNPCEDLLSASIMALSVASLAAPANAVSGGGLDFAGLDISGQNFSNDSKSYKGKDFTQVLAKATNFANSNFQGCRFYKAYLVNTDFSNSDIRGAAMEDTNMEGANLNNVIAAGAYFGQSLLDVKSAENADFTDATIPVKTLTLFCEREDVKGTNPVTGADTRESLMCP